MLRFILIVGIFALIAGGYLGMQKKGKLEHWQIIAIYLAVYDAIAVNAAYFLALWIRFDCRYSEIPEVYLSSYLKFAPWYTIFSVVIFWLLRLYKSIWRFASYSEFVRVVSATVITGLFHTIAITFAVRRMPISYYMFGILIQFLLTAGVRFSYRFVLLERGRKEKEEESSYYRIMLVGAGSAGQTILREMSRAREIKGKICCIIDDNSNKWGRYVDGVPVVGGRDDIMVNVKKYKINQIFFAIPSASAEDKRDILNICKETGCELKILPGIYQLVTGEIALSKMRRFLLKICSEESRSKLT